MQCYLLNSKMCEIVLPANIVVSFKKYFDSASKRYLISSRKNLLRRQLIQYMASTKQERFEQSGVHMDYLPRTTQRVDSRAIPLEIKEQCKILVKSVQLVPFDSATSGYLIGMGPYDDPEDEEVGDVETIVEGGASRTTPVYSTKEVVEMAREFDQLKSHFKHYDDLCKAHKTQIMDFMKEQKVDVLSHDGDTLRLVTRITKRFSSKKLSLEIVKEYTKKIESRVFNIYLLDDLKSIEKREFEDGTAELKRIATLKTPLRMEMLIDSD
jgi:hypothetical protein